MVARGTGQLERTVELAARIVVPRWRTAIVGVFLFFALDRFKQRT